MPKYIKKPIVVGATPWHKNGDHPEDGDPQFEGAVVHYYKRPEIPANDDNVRQLRQFHQSGDCKASVHNHGWIDDDKLAEGGHIVCPGDFIITGVKGERYPCKPDIFAATYDEFVEVRAELIDVKVFSEGELSLEERAAAHEASREVVMDALHGAWLRVSSCINIDIVRLGPGVWHAAGYTYSIHSHGVLAGQKMRQYRYGQGPDILAALLDLETKLKT